VSFSSDLFAGLAALLQGAGIGVYSEMGIFGPGDVGIFDKILPSTPDGGIALAQYPVSDDPSLSDSVIGVQVRTRMAGEDSRPIDDLADAIFNQLQGLADRTLAGGVHVVEAERRSGSPAVQDDLKRWTRADNYYLTVWRPSPNRT
jgi:hypothetical protein